MIKVRIKVKTIILALALIFTIIPFVNMELANYFSVDKEEIAEKLYGYYLKNPMVLRKDEALYKRGQTTMNDFERYSIMMGMRMGNTKLDYATINKSIEDYKKVIEDYPKSDYYTLAYKGILDSYIYKGDSYNLEKWIDWGKTNGKEDVIQISVLYEGYNHFTNGEYQKVDEILSFFNLGNKDMDYIYYFLKGHVEFAREDYNKALEYYNKASEIGWQHRTSFFGSRVPNRREDWLEELDFIEGEYKIKGRVTSEGVGIPFVEIYLQNHLQGYLASGMNFIAITDKDGYYETIGIKEGIYDLGIGIGTGILFDKAYLSKGLYNIEIPFEENFDFKFKAPIRVINPMPNEIIKSNKFEVEWEPVEEADYYTVESVAIDGGAVMIVALRDENKETKIRGNKGVFDIGIIKNSPTGYSIGEDNVVSPEAITGYLYEEKTTPIIVNAYDKDDKMVGSSVPLASYYENAPSIKIEGQLTEGEKLIVKKQYKEAVNYYEKFLLEDRNNIEALSYLSKLYIFGWGKGTIDVHKAIDYGVKVYDITGNADIILRVLGQMTSEDYRENKEVARELFDMIPDEYRDVNFYWYRGEYHRALGEFQKAREDLVLADNINTEDIVYMDMYLGEYERAIKFVKDKDISFYFMSKNKLIEGLEGLKKLDKNHKEYLLFKDYLSRILKREIQSEDSEDTYEKRKEDINKVYSQIKDPSIKTILNEMKAEYHW